MKYNSYHNIEPSVYLWLDNLLVERNEAFGNYSGSFLPGSSKINGFSAYVAPHRQFVYDSSIPGATVPSGIYIGGVFTGSGVNTRIDFNRGEVLLATATSSGVSGRYSYKEINLYFAEGSEQKVLFDSKFSTNPRTQSYTGSAQGDYGAPCIFIKSSAGSNKTLSFDNMAACPDNVRLLFLCENRYLYKAVCSVIRDQKERFIPIFAPSEMPFDAYYGLKSGVFDYSAVQTAIQEDSTRLVYIKDVKVSDFDERVNNLISPKMLGAFIDLELENIRFPHAE